MPERINKIVGELRLEAAQRNGCDSVIDVDVDDLDEMGRWLWGLANRLRFPQLECSDQVVDEMTAICVKNKHKNRFEISHIVMVDWINRLKGE